MPKPDAERLAEALRANLRRRKAQARARLEGPGTETPQAADDGAAQTDGPVQPGASAAKSDGAETNSRDQD